MKYFLDGWISGNHTDEQSSAVREAYWARIEEIKPHLSPEVRELTTNINLHDGLIRHIALDRAAQCLSISLRCGDLQVDYFDVDLVYADVESNLLDMRKLQVIATDPASELLYDEIDLGRSGRFVHRILFWPKPLRELEVVFRGLQVSIRRQPDRKFGK
jgi:Protein of unknown function (DUF4085)